MTRRVVIAAIALAAVLAAGTLGYVAIEGWTPLDALYMTVITVATVGFREVYPLSPAGQVFTIGLVAAGVGGIAYSVGIIAEFMVEGHLQDFLEGRRMKKRISELEGHYVVVGMGRVGSVVCQTLAEHGVPFVACDRREECAETAEERGWLFVLGDGTAEEVLRATGIERAKGLITALDTDADNLFCALTARELNPGLFIVARSTTVASEPKILRSGADRVVTPDVIGGRRMAAMALNPVVADYLDVVTHKDEIEFRLESLRVGEGSPLIGVSIRDERVDAIGAYVLAVSRDGAIDTRPVPETVFRAGDEVVCFGTRAQLDALAAALGR